MAIDDEETGMIVRPDGPASGNGSQVVRQGFGEQSMERRDTAATAVAARAQAEIQARFIVALQRPRNVDDARIRTLAHCRRPSFARSARYSKPVGGQRVEGASIRFVETALQEMGNIFCAPEVVHEDAEKITVRVTVTDLERNTAHADEQVVYKRVERRFADKGQTVIGTRMNKQGQQVFIVEATEDEFANKKAAAVSKLVRNLGLRLLPADIVEDAMEACIQTLREGAAKDPAGERKKVLDAFAAIGVMPNQIVEYLGHPLEQMQPSQLVDLREVYQAIRDGETTWKALMAQQREASTPESVTDAPTPAKGTEGAKARLAAKGAKAPPPAAPPAAAPTAASPSGEGAAPASMEQAAEEEPDELGSAYKRLRAGLEQVLAKPETLPELKARIEALPPGIDKSALQKMVAQAEDALKPSGKR